MEPKRQNGGDTALLDTDGAAALLRFARQTLQARLTGQPLPPAPTGNDSFQRPCGLFVSLHLAGALRGCIGTIESQRPLWQSVREMAIAAALDDSRFDPVAPEELGTLQIEISLLSPLEPVADPTRIQIGVHGLLVRRPGRSGLLLPQVATEYRWTREQFIEQTCQKAGLPKAAWQEPGTELLAFTAQVIAEP